MFGRHAFRKSANGQDSQTVINASLWDIFSTGLSRYPEHLVEANADKIKSFFSTLMDDDEFVRSITTGTNDRKRVCFRFDAANAMFEEIFDAHTS